MTSGIRTAASQREVNPSKVFRRFRATVPALILTTSVPVAVPATRLENLGFSAADLDRPVGTDQPTNNLNRQSVDQLVDALLGYHGALIVVSHDNAFLARLHLTATLALDLTGALAESANPTA